MILRFFKPLWIFLGGQFSVLLVWLFLPTLGDKCAQLLFNVPGDGLWGWTWAVGATRLIIVIFFELAILWKTGQAFLDAMD